MAGFIYHLPTDQPDAEKRKLIDGNKINHDRLRYWGLGHLTDCQIIPDHIGIREIARGPCDEKPGLNMFARPMDGSILGVHPYKPDIQTWVQAQDGVGRHWLGWYTEEPPGPTDLLKRDYLPTRYRLDDPNGNSWAIITARSGRKEEACLLPANYTFIKGELASIVQPKYRSLFDLSGVVMDHLSQIEVDPEKRDPNFEVNDSTLVKAAITCLAVNYRLGLTEIHAFELMGNPIVSTQNVIQILRAFVDQPLYEEFAAWAELMAQKKNTDPASSSATASSGSEDTTETTIPADQPS